nr:phage portal protein [Rhizobium leucaenae]
MAWFSRKQAAVPETKSELTDPTSESWEALLGGFATSLSTGVTVSAHSAMRVPAVNCAVRTIAETVATLPAQVFKSDGKSKQVDTSHPAHELVHDDANEWMSAGKLRENVTIDAILHGDGFAYVSKASDGSPMEILHLTRDKISVEYLLTGEPIYRVGGNETPADQIIHLQAPSIDGQRGLGLLSAGRDAIGLAILLERTAANLHKNNARPGGILSFKGLMKPDALKRAGEAWRKTHGGSGAGGVAPLDNDARYTPIAFTSVESQHNEQRIFSIGEISRLTRVPVTMLQELSSGTFANVEMQSLQFLQFCLLPWLRAWTDAYRRCLLQPKERGPYCISFEVADLLRGDSAARAEAYAKYRASGVMTGNDVRRELGLPALPDGDALSSPFTTAGAPAPANQNQPKPKEVAA